jgi:membrane protease YdiL (CAAX protease family)
MAYDPHDSLIRPARMSANPVRLVFGCVMVVAIYLSMALVFAQALPSVVGQTFLRDIYEEQAPIYVLLLLFEFAFLIVALSLVLRTMHRRPLISLFGRPDKATRQFLQATKFLLPLFLIFVLMPMPEPLQLTAQLGFGQWLLWLPLALPLVLVQVSAEELVFRGYLQSQLAARFRHPIIWIGLPSFLFGLLHYSPGLAGDNAWVLVVWATVFGAFAADLTARTGTLGPALALHFTNNVFAILITAPLGDLDGLALYTFPLSLATPGIASIILPLELMFALCAWLSVRLALRV